MRTTRLIEPRLTVACAGAVASLLLLQPPAVWFGFTKVRPLCVGVSAKSIVTPSSDTGSRKNALTADSRWRRLIARTDASTSSVKLCSSSTEDRSTSMTSGCFSRSVARPGPSVPNSKSSDFHSEPGVEAASSTSGRQLLW